MSDWKAETNDWIKKKVQWVDKNRRLLKPVDELPLLESCEYIAVEAPVKTPVDVFDYYDRIRNYIQHEDGLINSRLTWSLTIHGFLFAIYGILLGKISDEFNQIDKCPTVLLERVVPALFALQVPIALFGALVGHQSRNAIVSAHNAIRHIVCIAESSSYLKAHSPNSSVNAEDGSQKTPVEEAKSALVDTILLPKVVSGGAPKDLLTGGARTYYINLPLFAMLMWFGLGVVSLGSAITSLFMRNGFFWAIWSSGDVATSFAAGLRGRSRCRLVRGW